MNARACWSSKRLLSRRRGDGRTVKYMIDQYSRGRRARSDPATHARRHPRRSRPAPRVDPSLKAFGVPLWRPPAKGRQPRLRQPRCRRQGAGRHQFHRSACALADDSRPWTDPYCQPPTAIGREAGGCVDAGRREGLPAARKSDQVHSAGNEAPTTLLGPNLLGYSDQVTEEVIRNGELPWDAGRTTAWDRPFGVGRLAMSPDIWPGCSSTTVPTRLGALTNPVSRTGGPEEGKRTGDGDPGPGGLGPGSRP